MAIEQKEGIHFICQGDTFSHIQVDASRSLMPFPYAIYQKEKSDSTPPPYSRLFQTWPCTHEIGLSSHAPDADYLKSPDGEGFPSSGGERRKVGVGGKRFIRRRSVKTKTKYKKRSGNQKKKLLSCCI